ncbi:unnamed protein product [Allacma fusca]|uniref:Protein kinase domain-containing protein n=1 Tax=Allacma fusca TaxID=39272 RepID=A0A8J2Q799_9HEXA|nr:unnamed protein product [Allacma fusca]
MSRRSSKKKLSEQVEITRTPSQERVLRKRGYSIGKRIGEGSYAQVFKASFSDPKKNNYHEIKLACKIIDCTQISEKFSKKFLPREVEILGQLTHTNIIRVHSILQKKDFYYIFMEYADQGDLLEFILDHGAVKERQSRKWFMQILQGLKYLHDKDIAHRDLKCENLLLTAMFTIKISDFGFARFVEYERGQPVNSTTYCGSITYAAPEIVKGIPYNPKLADIWSIGVILYIMLNKSWPFDPSSVTGLYQAQMGRKWRVRTKVENILSETVKDFLRILLEPVPELRKTTNQVLLEPWVKHAPRDDTITFSGLGNPSTKTQFDSAPFEKPSTISTSNTSSGVSVGSGTKVSPYLNKTRDMAKSEVAGREVAQAVAPNAENVTLTGPSNKLATSESTVSTATDL